MNSRMQPSGSHKSMTLQWEDEFSDYMQSFAQAFDLYDQSREGLMGFMEVGGGSLNVVNAVECAAIKWIDNKCLQVSESVNKGTFLQIERTDLDSSVSRVMLTGLVGSGVSVADASVFELVDHVRLNFNVPKLYYGLISLGRKLLATGCRDSARYLGLELSLLTQCHHENSGPLKIKSVRGLMCLELPIYSVYWWERTKRLETIGQHIGVFEHESGVVGLLALVDLCIAEEKKHSRQRVKSRTRVSDGTGCAIFFKSKIVFHIERDIFIALLSFIMTFSDEGLHRVVKAA